MTTEVRVPTLGESVTEATVATWFKQAGEAVAVDEMLCELETDKVSIEVPSPASGVLKEIVAEAGATVEVNALIATVDESASGAVAAAAPAPRRRPRRRPRPRPRTAPPAARTSPTRRRPRS